MDNGMDLLEMVCTSYESPDPQQDAGGPERGDEEEDEPEGHDFSEYGSDGMAHPGWVKMWDYGRVREEGQAASMSAAKLAFVACHKRARNTIMRAAPSGSGCRLAYGTVLYLQRWSYGTLDKCGSWARPKPHTLLVTVTFGSGRASCALSRASSLSPSECGMPGKPIVSPFSPLPRPQAPATRCPFGQEAGFKPLPTPCWPLHARGARMLSLSQFPFTLTIPTLNLVGTYCTCPPTADPLHSRAPASPACPQAPSTWASCGAAAWSSPQPPSGERRAQRITYRCPGLGRTWVGWHAESWCEALWCVPEEPATLRSAAETLFSPNGKGAEESLMQLGLPIREGVLVRAAYPV